MTILIISLALLIDRVLWDADPYRNHDWLNRYFQWLARQGWLQSLSSHPAAVLLQLIPILLITAWLQSIFHDGWNGLLELAFGITVLLFSLGPKDLGRAGEAYLDAQNRDPQSSGQLAEAICVAEAVPDQEPARSLTVARCLLVEANNRLFAPLFWFVLLGPVGAVGYRCLYELASRETTTEDDTPEAPQKTGLAMYLADWIPARLTALGYATAGNFEAVFRIWKNAAVTAPEKSAASARHLLRVAGPAALDSFPSEEELEHMSEAPPVVEDALALVWRTLSLWVIILMISAFLAWLA